MNEMRNPSISTFMMNNSLDYVLFSHSLENLFSIEIQFFRFLYATTHSKIRIKNKKKIHFTHDTPFVVVCALIFHKPNYSIASKGKTFLYTIYIFCYFYFTILFALLHITNPEFILKNI